GAGPLAGGAARSALDELVVGLDAAVLVEDEAPQAGACHAAAAGRNHVPVELDHVVEAVGVVPRLEDELPRRDELLVGAGHPDFEFVVPAGFERGGGEAQPGGGFAVFPGRFQGFGALPLPPLLGGLVAPLGIRLVPDRHVAAGQLARVDLGHGFSMGLEVFVSRFDGAWGAAVRQFPAGNRRPGPDRVDTAAW